MGVIDRLGNIHGHKTGRFEEKPPKPVGPLVFFPDIDRSDDDEVGEWVLRIAMNIGTYYEDEGGGQPLYIVYSPEDLRDKQGLRIEIEKAQDFWAKATALGLTDWCSKEDFVHCFWVDRDGRSWHLRNGDTDGFARCPDEAIGQQLTAMARQYPACRLFADDIDDVMIFNAAGRDISDEEYEILQNGGTLE
jgi:hypothetical protein